MKLPNIWFVILTYNPDINLLKKNLNLLKQYQVIIVDNSTNSDVTQNLAALETSQIIVEIHEKNEGYTGGMNKGMKMALTKGAEWVVLLNDDVTLSEPGIKTLIITLTDGEPAIYGPYGGSLDPKRWTTVLSSQPLTKVDYLSGSFFAVHKNIIDVVKEFYPEYFMYYEDVDFCVQAKKKGFSLIQLSLPDITHQEGRSIERGSEVHEYYLARNHLLFVERQAPLFVRLHELVRLPKTIWEHKFFWNRGAFRGVIDFLFLRFGKARI